MAIKMKKKEKTIAEKAIRFEVEFDTNMENKKITTKGAMHIPTLIPVFPCWLRE